MISSLVRLLVVLGAVTLMSCPRSPLSGFSIPGVTITPPPAQVGGMYPVDGTDLLDISFSGDGVVETNDFSEHSPIGVALDSLSRPVVAGFKPFPYALRVHRYTEDGELDPTFGNTPGTDGVFLLDVDVPSTQQSGHHAPGLITDGLGRIWLLFTSSGAVGDEDVATVVRLTPDGVQDLSFGTGGQIFIDTSPEVSDTIPVELASDLLGGAFLCVNEYVAGSTRMVVIRLDENGQVDLSYGDAGMARGPESDASLASSFDVDGLGRITACGSLNTGPDRLAVWRFDAGGLSDLAFGGTGLVVRAESVASGIELRGVDVATDSSGRIVVVGDRSRDLEEVDDWPSQLVGFGGVPIPVFDAMVWRFLPDGGLDGSFASGGQRILAFNSGAYASVSGGSSGGDHFDASGGLLLDPTSGSIVVVGWSDPALWGDGWATFGPTCPFVVRLTSTGAVDSSFHGAGHVQIGWDDPGSTTFARGQASSIVSDARGRWLIPGRRNHSHSLRRLVPGS